MKNLRLLIVLALFAPLMSGCDSWLDVDRDPTAADNVPPSLLFAHVLANHGSNRAIEIMGATFWGQTWASGLSTSVLITSERYDISPFTTGNTWRGYYALSGIKDLRAAVREAMASEPVLHNQAAQAKLMMAHIFFHLTMMWEDVPFRDAGLLLLDPDDADAAQPRFDPQRDVLRGVVDLIDEAFADMAADAPGPPIGPHDVVYGGDMAKWVRFGNGLKFKALMFLRGGGESVDAELQALVNLPDDQMLRAASDNAQIPFGGATPNPRQHLATLFSGRNWVWTYGAEALVDYMTGATDPHVATPDEYLDPRLEVYLYRNAAGNFVGVVPGTSGAGRSLVRGHRFAGTPDHQVGRIVREDVPEPLLTAEEVLFLEAEFLALRGDLPGADAKYRDAINAHFASLAQDFHAVPAQIQIGEDEDEEPIFFATADWHAQRPNLTTLSQGEAVREIQRQHFVALFARAPNVWNHIRRTGELPGIERTLPVGADTPAFMNRLPYPPQELTANPNIPTPPPSRTAPMWFQP